MVEFAFATLVTSDEYAKGALVVGAALRELHPSPPTSPEVEFQTVCIVTPETVGVSTIKELRRTFDVVVGVEVIDEHFADGLALLGRPDLHSVLTKLHVFRLVQYSKVIFLDADTLPVRPLSHLFTLPYEFSAVPDVGWPDIFNSGMMVLTPGEDKFDEIRELVRVRGSWDGGDQGILNEWRGDDWHRLSFTYNTTPTAAYTYAPAYQRFGSKISVIHFIGQNKPWKSAPWRPPFAHSPANPSTSHVDPVSDRTVPTTVLRVEPPVSQQSYAYDSLVDRWFDVYDRHVRPQESVNSATSFQPERYEPAWDAPAPTGERPFDLDELKQMAITGSSYAPSAAAQPTSLPSGSYVSMPLEGRIDLMRPRPPSPPPQPPADHHASHDESHGSDHPQPGTPNERRSDGGGSQYHTPTVPIITRTEPSPPSPPERRSRSPPLVNWNPAIEPPPTTFVPNPTQQSIGEYYKNVWDMPVSHHAAPLHHDYRSYDDGNQFARGSPSPEGGHGYPAYDTSSHRSDSPSYYPPYPHHSGSPTHHHHHHSGSPTHRSSSPPHAYRAPSPRPQEFFHARTPPAIPHSVAHEYAAVMSRAPASNTTPAHPSTFPWEEATRRRPSRRFPAGEGPPPPPPVPAPVLRQPSPIRATQPFSPTQAPPNHRNVSFSGPQAFTSHVVPEASTASFLETVQHAQQMLSPSASGQEEAFDPRAAARSRYTPGDREAGSLVYSNAWDNIPSISRYVTKLSKPLGTAPGGAKRGSPTGSDGGRSPRQRTRSEEADDGDDEDDEDSVDDYDGGSGISTPQSTPRRDGRSGSSSRNGRSRGGTTSSSGGGRFIVPGPGSAKGGAVPGTTAPTTTPARVYRSQGVQTTPKSRRSVGVQVSVIVSSPVVPPAPVAATATTDDTVPTPPGAFIRNNRMNSAGAPPILTTPPQRSPSGTPIPHPNDGDGTPPARTLSGMLSTPPQAASSYLDRGMLDSPIVLKTSSPRTSFSGLGRGAAVSPSTPGSATLTLTQSPSTVVGSITSSPITRPNTLRQRTSSNATDPTVRASWMSSSSSGTVVEPAATPSSPEGVIIQPRAAVATRKFDPARGVDVFKRDSQEVLARFLRMSPWAEGDSAGSPTA